MKNNNYLKLLSRGRLTVPLQKLVDYTCNCFAALDFTSQAIDVEESTARHTAKYVLQKHCQDPVFTCNDHAAWGFKFGAIIIANVFFNPISHRGLFRPPWSFGPGARNRSGPKAHLFGTFSSIIFQTFSENLGSLTYLEQQL